MLVLMRKTGEEIVIDRKVHVRIMRVSGNRAFLAIEARPRFLLTARRCGWPRSVSVSRQATANRRSYNGAGRDEARHAGLRSRL